MPANPKSDTGIVIVFGSGRPRPGDPNYEEARLLGAELAQRGYTVCTGGYGGVMEAALRGAKEAGGRTIGVTTKGFHGQANAWIDEEREMESWQARLFELIRIGHGYVACKGGTGTLAELAVLWEMLNKGVLAEKPLAALGEFWQPVISRVIEGERDHSRERSEAVGRLIYVARDAREAAEWVTQAVQSRLPGDVRASF